MNVEEALHYLETLDEEESELIGMQSASVFISPPVNEPGDRSDEDSADEDFHIHNLGSRQIRADATVVIERRNERQELNEDEGTEQFSSIFEPKWVNRDLNKRISEENFRWNLPPPALDSNDSPSTLFEKFFTIELMDYICDETKKYAAANGKESFNLETSELRVFIATCCSTCILDTVDATDTHETTFLLSFGG